MPRTAKQVLDPFYDEVSFVDVPAAADARIAITKRHMEAAVADEYIQPEHVFDAEGNEVDQSTLEDGDIVFTGDGQAVRFELADEDEPDKAEEADAGNEGVEDRQLTGAGVSKAFQTRAKVSKSLSETLREELAKAASDAERVVVLEKALNAQAERAEQALEIAKRHEDMRLDAEYTEIAKGYNVPEDPTTLGPILKRMAQRLPEKDCAVIHKLLSSVGEVLATELGYSGTAEIDPYDRLEAMLDQTVEKSAGKVSKAQATEAYFDADPREYEAYLAQNAR